MDSRMCSVNTNFPKEHTTQIFGETVQKEKIQNNMFGSVLFVPIN